MKLSRNSKPLYLQIENIIKDRILHGVYPLGTYIPPEPELEAEFNVSKITVRNAIKELAQQGYLEKSSGKGTKVIRNTSASKLSKWKRFTEVLVDEGHQIQKQLLQVTVISNEEGTEPYRLFGERCLFIERIYKLNDQPYIHYTHYLTARMEEVELSDLDNQSLYGLLEEQHIALERFRDEFAVGKAPAHVEKILGVPEHTPLLKRSRYSYDEQGDVIEYNVGYYNTQMHSYVINYDA